MALAQEKLFLSPEVVAEILDLDVNSVRAGKGGTESLRRIKFGRLTKIPREDLEKLIEEKLSQAETISQSVDRIMDRIGRPARKRNPRHERERRPRKNECRPTGTG
jgi:hypothetical protein